MAKYRLDVLVTERGLAESREKARAMIMAGDVKVGGAIVTKPGTMIVSQVDVQVAEKPLYVSRGGIKLEHALKSLSLNPSGMVVADIGASTGGFTDCLLKKGAERVYAIDVGYGQLDYRLRIDHRVVVKERVNARYPFELPELVDMVTMDVSFISVRLVLPSVARFLKAGGAALLLFKPQFEVGKGQVGKGGVVRDPFLHAQTLGKFIIWAVENRYKLLGLEPSPILGDAGNREFFFLLKPQIALNAVEKDEKLGL